MNSIFLMICEHTAARFIGTESKENGRASQTSPNNYKIKNQCQWKQLSITFKKTDWIIDAHDRYYIYRVYSYKNDKMLILRCRTIEDIC